MLRQGATRGFAAPNPPSSTRPAAPRPINTVINRENPVTWHCFGSRRLLRLLPRPPLEHGHTQVPRSLCRRGGRSGVQSLAALSWRQGSVAAFWLLPPSCCLSAEPGGGPRARSWGARGGGSPAVRAPSEQRGLADSSPGQQEDAVLLAWAEDGARTASGPSQAGGDG